MSKRMFTQALVLFTLCIVSMAEDHQGPETDPTLYNPQQVFRNEQQNASTAFFEMCRKKLEKSIKSPKAIRKSAKVKPVVCFAKTQYNRTQRIKPIVKVGKNAFRARAYIKFQGCLQGVMPNQFKKKDIECVEEKDSGDYTQGRLKETMSCLFRAVGMRSSVEDEFNLYGLLREGSAPQAPTKIYSCQVNSVKREDKEVEISPAAWSSENKVFSQSKVLEQLCERGFGPEVLEASNMTCNARVIEAPRKIASED